MRVIVAGSRDCPVTYMQVVRGLRSARFPAPTAIVHGGCPTGADAAAGAWAKLNGVFCRVFPAEWERLGLAAGPARNREMAEYGQALLAFWDGQSRGTSSMIAIAGGRGLRVHVVRVTPPARRPPALDRPSRPPIGFRIDK